MAKLRAVVDSLDGVPAAHRDLYVPLPDGRHVLDLDDGDDTALTQAHTAALRAKDAELADLVAVLRETRTERLALSAISAAGGNAALLLPHVTARLRLRPDGTPEVIDRETGSPRLTLTGAFSLDDLLTELRHTPAFAAAFRR